MTANNFADWDMDALSLSVDSQFHAELQRLLHESVVLDKEKHPKVYARCNELLLSFIARTNDAESTFSLWKRLCKGLNISRLSQFMENVRVLFAFNLLRGGGKGFPKFEGENYQARVDALKKLRELFRQDATQQGPDGIYMVWLEYLAMIQANRNDLALEKHKRQVPRLYCWTNSDLDVSLQCRHERIRAAMMFDTLGGGASTDDSTCKWTTRIETASMLAQMRDDGNLGTIPDRVKKWCLAVFSAIVHSLLAECVAVMIEDPTSTGPSVVRDIVRAGKSPCSRLLAGQEQHTSDPHQLDLLWDRVRTSETMPDLDTRISSRWAAMRLAMRTGRIERSNTDPPTLRVPLFTHLMRASAIGNMVREHAKAPDELSRSLLDRIPKHILVEYSSRLVQVITSEALDWHTRAHGNNSPSIASMLVALQILGLDDVVSFGRATEQSLNKAKRKQQNK